MSECGFPGVFTYSQLRIAKKNAPVIRETINLSLLPLTFFFKIRSIEGVSGDSLLTSGSNNRYNASIFLIMPLNFPCSSVKGLTNLLSSCSSKAYPTFVMILCKASFPIVGDEPLRSLVLLNFVMKERAILYHVVGENW